MYVETIAHEMIHAHDHAACEAGGNTPNLKRKYFNSNRHQQIYNVSAEPNSHDYRDQAFKGATP